MVESPFVRAALRAASALVLAFIYLPLIILAVYAFNESKLAAWPPTGLDRKSTRLNSSHT